MSFILYIIICAKMSSTFEVALATANPSFDLEKIRYATRNDERRLYTDRYRHNVIIDGKIIGYAIYNNWRTHYDEISDNAIVANDRLFPVDLLDTYWCGYCQVPDTWFANEEWEEHLSTPIITHVNNKKKIIGWDHAHYYDTLHYSNLAAVINEIMIVWNCVKKSRLNV